MEGYGLARQVADIQILRLTENILNKKSWTVDNGWSSSFGVGRGANNSSP
jgi:hypothetical protein